MRVAGHLAEVLDAALQDIRTDVRVFVAYSGGLDSQCLLHLSASWARKHGIGLVALHLNHGLSPNANRWQAFCMQQCQQLKVALICNTVDLNAMPQRNTEQRARDARYAWFDAQLEQGDIVLTAHHQQDQAETLLLRILRASGTRGLAAIPPSRRLGKGAVLRPFLQQSKEDLREYAEQHQLQWVEDESNSSVEFDRNYIRHEVMPGLLQRWPQAAELLSRTAQHCSDDQQLLDELAESDAQIVQNALAIVHPEVMPALDLLKFRVLSSARQRNLLLYLLRPFIVYPVPAAKLKEWLRQVNNSQPGDSARLQLNSMELILYNGQMHFIQCTTQTTPVQPLSWKTDALFSVPGMPYSLTVIQRSGSPVGSAKTLAFEPGEEVSVHWRRGGERVQLQTNEFSRPLKKLLQEARIPPWLRSSMPLITIEGYIVWSAALGDFAPRLVDESGCQYSFEWTFCEQNKSEC
jgi:tRNA(Ile)-lysidine synthase